MGGARRGLGCLLAVVVALSGARGAAAQEGDHEGEAQPEVWREMDVPPAPALTAAEELRTFRVAPGFRVELVAAEPLVVDPIAIAWDEDGRLWAVELRAFMPDVDGKGETAPLGRIVVLEDDDADGRMDRSTVFLDGLVNPRAVAIVAGGTLVAEPPHLWLCTDTDGDLECDEKREVAPYGDPDPDSLEHTDNGLRRCLDNWIYNAKSRTRMRWDGERMHREETAFRGQWGIDQDDTGRLYYNSNSTFLMADLLPAERLRGNPHAGPAVGLPATVGARLVKDESVHTIRVNPGINRGYQSHMLKEDGRLARTTAVSGLAVYRGQQFPEEYRGDVFVPEPAGNVLCAFDLRDDGLAIRAKKRLIEDPDWGEREFLVH